MLAICVEKEPEKYLKTADFSVQGSDLASFSWHLKPDTWNHELRVSVSNVINIDPEQFKLSVTNLLTYIHSVLQIMPGVPLL